MWMSCQAPVMERRQHTIFLTPSSSPAPFMVLSLAEGRWAAAQIGCCPPHSSFYFRYSKYLANMMRPHGTALCWRVVRQAWLVMSASSRTQAKQNTAPLASEDDGVARSAQVYIHLIHGHDTHMFYSHNCHINVCYFRSIWHIWRAL